MRTLLLTAALALCAGAASAEVEPQAVRWQHISKQKQESAKPMDVAELALPLEGKLLARVKLLNRGPATEGVLLRYSLTPKISADAHTAPVGVVPFVIEEKRVPKIGANQFLEVTLDLTPAVTLYLKKIARDDFKLREIRLQLMVSPRRGEKGIKTIESALPIKP